MAQVTHDDLHTRLTPRPLFAETDLTRHIVSTSSCQDAVVNLILPLLQAREEDWHNSPSKTFADGSRPSRQKEKHERI